MASKGKPARKQPDTTGQFVTLAVSGPGKDDQRSVKIPLDKPPLEVAIEIEPFIAELPRVLIDALAEAATWVRVARNAA